MVSELLLVSKVCNDISSVHTIQKYKKMAGQNTFQILVLNDANMIGEH